MENARPIGFLTDLEVLAEAMPEPIWVASPSGNVEYVSGRWTEYTGLSLEESRGNGWLRAIHPDDVATANVRFLDGLRTGAPIEMECRLRSQSGEYHWFLSRGVPQRDGATSIVRWIGSWTDIDYQRRSLEAFQLLADTGGVLGQSLDLKQMLDMLLPILVPRVCDWAAICLVDGENELVTASILHRDVDKSRLAQQMIGKAYYYADSEVSATYRAFKSGDVVVWDRGDIVPTTDLRFLEILETLGMRHSVVAPLKEDGRTLGVLAAVRTDENLPFTPAEVQLLRELAARATHAITRARLSERERLLAQTLQAASLPAELPQVSGFRFDAFYAPARREGYVGGDWYDAFAVGAGRIVVTVGDVAGSGLNAAATMNRVRHTIRALTLQDTDPVKILAGADVALRRDHPDLIVTALVGFIDPARNLFEFATAGHPAPMLRLEDGTVWEFPSDGLPLGLIAQDELPVRINVELPKNSILVMFTDGLIEETRNIIEGEDRLRKALSDTEIVSAASPARYLYERIVGDGGKDDVAIVCVDVSSRPSVPRTRRGIPEIVGRTKLIVPAWTVRWNFEVLDTGSPASARGPFMTFLRKYGEPSSDFDGAEVIFGELIANVVRHAAPPVQVELDWTSRHPVLHIIDRGPGFAWRRAREPKPFQDSGRGLYMVFRLAEDLKVTEIPHYGTHIRVTLPVTRSMDDTRA